MKFIKGLLKFLLALAVLETVFVIHEYGHLREFQKRNVAIKEFSLGIGWILFQHKTESGYMVNFRILPIMAYVAPTEKAGKLFIQQAALKDKVSVDTAGVRNNFVAGLTPLLILQILGWKRGNISLLQLVKTAIATPLKLIPRFAVFLLGIITWGRVNLAEKFLLSTAGIQPPKYLRAFIVLNLSIGLLNLAPVSPLDGWHVVQGILFSIGWMSYTFKIPAFLGFILFMVCFTAATNQDMRVLDIQPNEDKK